MQFKKLAAVAGSALMAGLALAGPVLATQVSQLGKISDMVSVTNSVPSFPIFVIGASAQTADVAGAVDIAANLASNAVVTSSVTSTIPGESVTGGAKISTTGVYLTPYTNPQNVKGIMTASDVPSLLGGGTYSSASGGSYSYKQYLYILGETTNNNGAQIVFARPTTENSPRLAFKTPASQGLYEYKLTFSTPVSLSGVTDTTTLKNVIQGTTINLLGKDFVISDCTYASSAISDITLLGGNNIVSVETGTPKTVTTASKDYTVTLSGVAAQSVGTSTYYSAIGDVNGEAFTLKAGETKTLSDGTLIAAIKVFQGKTGAADYATIAIGADKVLLSSAGTVTKGTTVVSELTAGITSSVTAGWSVLTITYTPSLDKWISAGDQVTDPFASTFSIKFNSIIPDFSDTTNRQILTFSPSGYNLLLTYKNAADAEKQSYTLYANTSGTTLTNWLWASALAGSPTYFDNNVRDIVFDEGKNISAVEQDYFAIQKGGFSHVLQFTSYTNSTKSYTFTDESGNSLTATGTTGVKGDTADLIVDGNTFKVLLVDDLKKVIRVDLNGNSTIGGQASTYTNILTFSNDYTGVEYSYLVPKLITAGQGGVYFYGGGGSTWGNSSVLATTAGKYAKLGLVELLLKNTSATNVDVYVGSTKVGSFTNNSAIAYTTASAASGYMEFGGICSGTIDITCNVGLGDSNTGMLTDPGFVLVEEALQGGTTHNWLFLPIKWDTTNSRTYVGTTFYSGDTHYTDNAVLGTSTEYKGMTSYGTLSDHLASTLGGSATLNYPDVFTYANVYVLTPTGTIASGGTGGTLTTQQVLPITGDVVKLDTDSDINTAIQNNDVIIVGGPCINKIAAQVLGKTYPACGASSGIPENAALIELFTDKFATGKTALLVAGWEAVNTDLAARIVQTEFPGATTAQLAGTTLTITGTVASPSYS
jgi:hypothetical protein